MNRSVTAHVILFVDSPLFEIAPSEGIPYCSLRFTDGSSYHYGNSLLIKEDTLRTLADGIYAYLEGKEAQDDE